MLHENLLLHAFIYGISNVCRKQWFITKLMLVVTYNMWLSMLHFLYCTKPFVMSQRIQWASLQNRIMVIRNLKCISHLSFPITKIRYHCSSRQPPHRRDSSQCNKASRRMPDLYNRTVAGALEITNRFLAKMLFSFPSTAERFLLRKLNTILTYFLGWINPLYSVSLPLMNKYFKGSPFETCLSFLPMQSPEVDIYKLLLPHRQSQASLGYNTNQILHWCKRVFSCPQQKQDDKMVWALPAATQSEGRRHFSHILCPNPDCWRTEANPAKQRSVQHYRTNPTSSAGQHILGAASLTPQLWSLNSLCPQPAPPHPVTGCEEPLNTSPSAPQSWNQHYSTSAFQNCQSQCKWPGSH